MLSYPALSDAPQLNQIFFSHRALDRVDFCTPVTLQLLSLRKIPFISSECRYTDDAHAVLLALGVPGIMSTLSYLLSYCHTCVLSLTGQMLQKPDVFFFNRFQFRVSLHSVCLLTLEPFPQQAPFLILYKHNALQWMKSSSHGLQGGKHNVKNCEARIMIFADSVSAESVQS